MKEQCCVHCGATENLIEEGGQFCGGTWYLCQKCDEEVKRFAEFMKSDEFKELISKVNNI